MFSKSYGLFLKFLDKWVALFSKDIINLSQSNSVGSKLLFSKSDSLLLQFLNKWVRGLGLVIFESKSYLSSDNAVRDICR